MTYQIIAVAAIVIALVAIIVCINTRNQLYTYFDVTDSDIKALEKRMDNFAEAKKMERIAQYHAETKK